MPQPFFNPQGELDATAHPRTYREEAQMARSAIDCVLNGEDAVYASSELTTGPRLFGLLREHGLTGATALKLKLGDDAYRAQVFEPNVADALAFAHALRERLPGHPLVVTPAPYVAPGWSQAEYLAFWESLIRSRFAAVYFGRDWEQSSGCLFELAVALDAGLATFDEEGQPLGRERGLTLASEAIERLAAECLDVSDLRRNLGRLAAGDLQESDRLAPS